jgi:hypothetical protein
MSSDEGESGTGMTPTEQPFCTECRSSSGSEDEQQPVSSPKTTAAMKKKKFGERVKGTITEHVQKMKLKKKQRDTKRETIPAEHDDEQQVVLKSDSESGSEGKQHGGMVSLGCGDPEMEMSLTVSADVALSAGNKQPEQPCLPILIPILIRRCRDGEYYGELSPKGSFVHMFTWEATLGELVAGKTTTMDTATVEAVQKTLGGVFPSFFAKDIELRSTYNDSPFPLVASCEKWMPAPSAPYVTAGGEVASFELLPGKTVYDCNLILSSLSPEAIAAFETIHLPQWPTGFLDYKGVTDLLEMGVIKKPAPSKAIVKKQQQQLSESSDTEEIVTESEAERESTAAVSVAHELYEIDKGSPMAAVLRQLEANNTHGEYSSYRQENGNWLCPVDLIDAARTKFRVMLSSMYNETVDLSSIAATVKIAGVSGKKDVNQVITELLKGIPVTEAQRDTLKNTVYRVSASLLVVGWFYKPKKDMQCGRK